MNWSTSFSSTFDFHDSCDSYSCDRRSAILVGRSPGESCDWRRSVTPDVESTSSASLASRLHESRVAGQNRTQLTTRSMPCAVSLGWLENAYSCPPLRWKILTRKVGQTDLVSSMRSGFISRSVRARLKVSACSGYDVVPPWLSPRHTSTHTQRDSILSSLPVHEKLSQLSYKQSRFK